MKNKSLTYILLGGAALVWGLIFYRIFAGLDSTDEAGVSVPQKRKELVLSQEKEEKLILIANYRDPFIGGLPKGNTNFGGTSNQTKIKKQAVVKKVEPEIVIDWSIIDFVGLVYNKETKKNVGILKISGKEYMVEDKDVVNGVTILKKSRDSIFVNYLGKDKWIGR